MLSFHSFLAEPIRRFIELRRLSGTDYYSQALLLQAFDQPLLNRQLVEAYQESLSPLAPRTRSNRMCVVRQLCCYLVAHDSSVYIPAPLRTIPSAGAYAPYIYSQQEVQALITAAAILTPIDSLRPYTIGTLLGLLYSTGLRIGEAIALNLDDFHLPQQRLFIAMGKFHKARWIPITSSVCQAIERYVQRRLVNTPLDGQAPLFINLRGHRVLEYCNIDQNKPNNPHLHSFRHTFAVTRLLAWYREGCDVNARLPELATYMGHVNIASTQRYLQPIAELLEQVDQRFHAHFLSRVIPWKLTVMR